MKRTARSEVVRLPVPKVELAGDPSIVRLDDKGTFFLSGATSRLGWDTRRPRGHLPARTRLTGHDVHVGAAR